MDLEKIARRIASVSGISPTDYAHICNTARGIIELEGSIDPADLEEIARKRVPSITDEQLKQIMEQCSKPGSRVDSGAGVKGF